MKDLYGCSFALSEAGWLWDLCLELAGKLAAFLWFWTHWSSKDPFLYSGVWDLSSALFRAWLVLKQISLLSSPTTTISFLSKKSKSKPRLPDLWSGRLLYVWLQVGCYSRFCNTWCLVLLHQMMDGWFCWFPSWPGHPWTFCLFCGRPMWL